GSDDCRTARCTYNHVEFPASFKDGWCHGTQHALFGQDLVCFAADCAIHIRMARLNTEIIHFIIEKETSSGHNDAATITVVERSGNSHCISRRINYGKMCCLFGFIGEKCTFLYDRTWGCVGFIKRIHPRTYVLVVEQLIERNIKEVGVTEVRSTVCIYATFGFGIKVYRLRRVMTPLTYWVGLNTL